MNNKHRGIYSSNRTSNLPKIIKDNNTNQFAKDQIPDKIRDTYVKDYDIKYVDSVVRKKLIRDRTSKVSGLENEIREYEEILKDKDESYTSKMQCKDKIMEIKDEIESIISGRQLEKYVEETRELIAEYTSLGICENRISFGHEEQIVDYTNPKRIALIEKYLDVAKIYYDVEIYNIPVITENNCISCGAIITEEDVSEEGLKQCPSCYATYKTVIYNKTAKDSDRITCIKTEDESLENFIKSFYRKQGLKSGDNIDDVCQELESYSEVTPGIISGAEIRNLPLNVRGKKNGTNLVMLQKQLYNISRNNYYEDANLIAHKYWGWQLPDYSHLYDRVIRIYNETLKVFKNIPMKERERKSNLSTQFVLFKILQLCGADVIEEEFKIVENRKSRISQNRIWKIMCDEAHKKYADIYYIP